jgi:adenosine deaminase
MENVDHDVSLSQHVAFITNFLFFDDLTKVCEDAVKDGVRYIEIRFSPILHVRGGLSLSGVMEAVVQGHVHTDTLNHLLFHYAF